MLPGMFIFQYCYLEMIQKYHGYVINIKIRAMIRGNEVRPVWQRCIFQSLDPVQTQKTKGPTPKNKNTKRTHFAFGINQLSCNYWVKQQRCRHKNDKDIKFPDKTKYTNNTFHLTKVRISVVWCDNYILIFKEFNFSKQVSYFTNKNH